MPVHEPQSTLDHRRRTGEPFDGLDPAVLQQRHPMTAGAVDGHRRAGQAVGEIAQAPFLPDPARDLQGRKGAQQQGVIQVVGAAGIGWKLHVGAQDRLARVGERQKETVAGPRISRLKESPMPAFAVCSRRSRAGFTLIELLVVIAIIAILAAILFPVFAKARDRARQASCLNNSRQIGTAMTLYLDEWEGVFPNQWWRDKCGEFNCTPARQLKPYTKTSQIYVCPSKGRGAPDPEQTGFISYGFNGLVLLEDQGINTGEVSSLDDPVQTIVVTETGGCEDVKRTGGSVGNGACDGAWLDTFWMANSFPHVKQIKHPGSNTNTNHRFQTQHAKHAGTVNVVYVDGHVKNTAPSRLTWGNFWGHLNPTYKAGGVTADTPVASQEMDRADVEP